MWRTSGLYRVQFNRDTGTEFRRTDLHVALGSQVVNLIRSNLPQNEQFIHPQKCESKYTIQYR